MNGIHLMLLSHTTQNTVKVMRKEQYVLPVTNHQIITITAKAEIWSLIAHNESYSRSMCNYYCVIRRRIITFNLNYTPLTSQTTVITSCSYTVSSLLSACPSKSYTTLAGRATVVIALVK